MYTSEDLMSVDFEEFIKSTMGNTYFKEWQGLFGIPDYVCFSKLDTGIKVVSFELKLKNWRGAMIQAFRYRSFSDYSYVVLPEETAGKAFNHINLFKKYGIGLISFRKDKYFIMYSPIQNRPLSLQLREKAETKIRRSRKKSHETVNVLL